MLWPRANPWCCANVSGRLLAWENVDQRSSTHQRHVVDEHALKSIRNMQDDVAALTRDEHVGAAPGHQRTRARHLRDRVTGLAVLVDFQYIDARRASRVDFLVVSNRRAGKRHFVPEIRRDVDGV